MNHDKLPLSTSGTNLFITYRPLPRAGVWSPPSPLRSNSHGNHCIICSEEKLMMAQLVRMDANTIACITENHTPISLVLWTGRKKPTVNCHQQNHMLPLFSTLSFCQPIIPRLPILFSLHILSTLSHTLTHNLLYTVLVMVSCRHVEFWKNLIVVQDKQTRGWQLDQVERPQQIELHTV